MYGPGSSSLEDVELGRRLLCKLSEDEKGRRQVMHEPNAIWVTLVHEKGVVIWQENLLGWEVEGNLKGT